MLWTTERDLRVDGEVRLLERSNFFWVFLVSSLTSLYRCFPPSCLSSSVNGNSPDALCCHHVCVASRASPSSVSSMCDELPLITKTFSQNPTPQRVAGPERTAHSSDLLLILLKIFKNGSIKSKSWCCFMLVFNQISMILLQLIFIGTNDCWVFLK